jgi:hypothetical protein
LREAAGPAVEAAPAVDLSLLLAGVAADFLARGGMAKEISYEGRAEEEAREEVGEEARTWCCKKEAEES